MRRKKMRFENLEAKKLFTVDLGVEPPGMDVECRSDAVDRETPQMLSFNVDSADGATSGNRTGNGGGGGGWLGNHNIQLLRVS